MRNLLNFLMRYNHWLVFLLLQVISLLLLFRFNNYQHSRFFTSTNAMIGAIYQATSNVTTYFNLSSENEALMDRNIYLEKRVAELEKLLNDQSIEEHQQEIASQQPEYATGIKARVIKNSLTKTDNYITLDAGRDKGVRPDMAVISASGVAGIVYKTSANYALVLPLLNSKSSVSCKIRRSNYFGHLKWEGEDAQYGYLKDLPRHAEVVVGDTVVTSGYSAVFPEGMMVGIVADISDSDDRLSYLLKVKLATDFGNLSNVRILARPGQEEQLAIETINN